MTVPNPLPPVLLRITVYDYNGIEFPGFVVYPTATHQGQTKSLVMWPTAAGWMFEYMNFDPASDPAPALTYRYDSDYIPDFVPAVVDGRIDALEASQAAQDVTIAQAASDAAGAAAAVAAMASTVAALQSAIATLAAASSQYEAALSEIREKYVAHTHGLLGLGGDPQGEDGDLNYTLPGD